MKPYEAEIILSPNGGYSRSVVLTGGNLANLRRDCKKHVQENGFRGGGSRGGIVIRYPIVIGDRMDVTDVEDWVYYYNEEKDKFIFKRGYYDPNEFLNQLTMERKEHDGKPNKKSNR